MVDTTGDGKGDITLVDTTGDGTRDAVFDKGRHHGPKPAAAIDITGDGHNDTVLLDTSKGGCYDTAVHADKAGLTLLAVDAAKDAPEGSSRGPRGLFPPYWSSSSDQFMNLQESDFIFKFAHDLLNQTFQSVVTRDRSARLPQWLDPVKISVAVATARRLSASTKIKGPVRLAWWLLILHLSRIRSCLHQ